MQAHSSSVAARLQKLRPMIEELRSISGAPGLALGVIHNGRIVHEDFFGYRDVQQQLRPDRNTLFYVASLTKAMTAVAMGILVDESTLNWESPVHNVLPQMSKSTKHFQSGLTVVDLMSHRTGTAWADALYLQSNNHILLPKEESIRTFDYLPVVAPPRSRYMYNNHAYNIAGLVIEEMSGVSWGQFVKERLFEPLGMSRTFTEQPEDANTALPYNILHDGTPFRIPFSEVSDKTMMFAGQSVRTSLADLLRFYDVLLENLQLLESSVVQGNELPQRPIAKSWWQPTRILQCFQGQESVPEPITEKPPNRPIGPIKQIAQIIRPHIARPIDSLFEQTYALGWNRTQLPGKLDFGWNAKVVKQLPILGQEVTSRLAIWHGGNMPGTTAAVCLLPETTTCVVVLQNSLGLCDAADWVCQLAVETILAGRPMNDYLSLAAESVHNGVARMKEVQLQLDKEREVGTTHRPLEVYVGRYYNAIGNWVIEIGLDGANGLFLKFQARDDEKYWLRHYHYDTFVWNLSYDETVKRAQYCRPAEYYKMEFEGSTGRCVSEGKGEGIVNLRWRHDASVLDGEVFSKAQ